MRFPLDSGRLDPEFNPFEDEYLGEILQAVALAWAQMKSPKSGEIENQITRRLAGLLKNDPAFENIPYDIVLQYPLIQIDGEILGQLDLHFKHRQSQKDYFAFEAKRLHVLYPGGTQSTEYSIYSGGAGMGAFIEGQYSKDLPAAGMLGYVMDGNTCKAWKGLGKSIESKRADLRLSTAKALSASSLRTSLAGAKRRTLLGETLHHLASHDLRLFHLLLP